MATLDDINILDRVKTDPQLLLQAGRQPTVERVKPTFNPASDYFYNNVLNDSGRRMVDFASSEANNSFNFGITGPINKANKARQGIASLRSKMDDGIGGGGGNNPLTTKKPDNIIKLDMSRSAKQNRDYIKKSKEYPYFSGPLQGMNRDLPLKEQLGKTAEQKEAVNFLLNKNPNTFENFKIGTIIKDNASNMTYQIDRYNAIRENVSNIKPALVVKVLEDKGFQKIYNKGDITQLDLTDVQESISKNPNAFTIFTGPKK
jgi:hypothetical protein